MIADQLILNKKTTKGNFESDKKSDAAHTQHCKGIELEGSGYLGYATHILSPDRKNSNSSLYCFHRFFNQNGAVLFS